MVQWYSYGGSWKWVTILPILSGSLQLLFVICFCIPSYVHQQLLSLDCQNFVHYNSLVFFYLSRELSWCRVSFLKGDLQFSKMFKNTIFFGCVDITVHWKTFHPFNPPPPIFSLSSSTPPYRIFFQPSSSLYPSILSILLGVHSKQSSVLIRFAWLGGEPSFSAVSSYCSYIQCFGSGSGLDTESVGSLDLDPGRLKNVPQNKKNIRNLPEELGRPL